MTTKIYHWKNSGFTGRLYEGIIYNTEEYGEVIQYTHEDLYDHELGRGRTYQISKPWLEEFAVADTIIVKDP